MHMKAIVYTSNTGHTAAYAKLLGERTGLPVFALSEVADHLEKRTPIVYLGWLLANNVQGYRKAVKNFTVCAVCGVGLCDTGTMLDEVRKATDIPGDMPLFTLQGGMDRGQLRGVHKMMIRMLEKGLSAQKQRSEQEEHLLTLLQQNRNYVNVENLDAVLRWYGGAAAKAENGTDR